MKRVMLVALVAALGLVIAVPASASFKQPSAHAAKKCKKKHGKKKCKKKHPVAPAPVPLPTPPAPPPTPKALTDAEVIQQVATRAGVYCAVDPDCIGFGYYSTDPGGQFADCDSKTTLVWACYGWNDEDIDADPEADATCDFREIVERVGIDGITSHQDLGFGNSGWDCFVI